MRRLLSRIVKVRGSGSTDTTLKRGGSDSQIHPIPPTSPTTGKLPRNASTPESLNSLKYTEHFDDCGSDDSKRGDSSPNKSHRKSKSIIKDRLKKAVYRTKRALSTSTPTKTNNQDLLNVFGHVILENEEDIKIIDMEDEKKVQELIDSYRSSELHQAAIRGDCSTIQRLISEFVSQKKEMVPDLSEQEESDLTKQFCSRKAGRDENSALHLACLRGKTEVVEFLISHCGVDVNILSKEGLSPLHSACSKNQRSVAQYLLAHGADLTIRDNMGYAPFHIACLSNAFEIADDMLLTGADIEFKRFDGRTTLHIMAEQGNINGLKFLLEKHSVNTIAKDQKGNIALINAVKKNKVSVIRYLIQYHQEKKNLGQILKQKNQLGRNIIHICVDDLDREDIAHEMTRTLLELLRDEREIVHLLLNDADKVCNYTPLHCAVRRNYPYVVRLLLKHGSDVNACDEKGNTPLHLAVLNKMNSRTQQQEVWEQTQLLVMQMLLEYPRTKLDIKNNNKQTVKVLIGGGTNSQFKLLVKNIKKLRKEAATFYN